MTVEFLPLVSLTILGTPVLLLVMLLPTLLEVKKPKDAGPRLIMHDLSKSVHTGSRGASSLEDIEVYHELEFLITPLVSDVLSVLPGIEV